VHSADVVFNCYLQTMLLLINDRLSAENTDCDEVMLHAWSLLWNVTGLLI